jgi:hypothetical protein
MIPVLRGYLQSNPYQTDAATAWWQAGAFSPAASFARAHGTDRDVLHHNKSDARSSLPRRSGTMALRWLKACGVATRLSLKIFVG